jgi:SHS family lactate transporter-like MFS transporter
LIGVVSAFVLIVTAFGPEYVIIYCLSHSTLNFRRNHGLHFEKAKTAFEEGGGRDEIIEEPESPPAEKYSIENEKADSDRV